MDLREIEWGGMDWIDLAPNMDQWRALLNVVMNLRVLWNVGKCLSTCTTGCSLKRVQLREISQLVS
jgi:hypothetical protein